MLLASASDVDDLVPTLVAYQIEWNKIRVRLRGAATELGEDPDAETCARVCGGSVDDWQRLRESWGMAFAERLKLVRDVHLSLRVRMLGGSSTGYARMTRRWWAPVQTELDRSERDSDATGPLASSGGEGPLYFVSSNTHSLVNIATGLAREREQELVEFVETLPADDILREELTAFREGEHRGLVGELPVLRGASVLQRAGSGGRGRASGGGGGARHQAPSQHHRAARAGPDHPARRAERRVARSATRRGRRGGAGGEPGADRQHRLSARGGGLQHPARDRRRHAPRCAASTCSARRRR